MTDWHPFDGTHHHGYDPKTFLPIFGQPLAEYLATYGEIGFPWATSPEEEHEGYLWLYTTMRPGVVDQFNNGGKLPWDTLHYVKHALVQVHTTGEVHHLYKRFHSHYGFFVVENRYTGEQGVVATGGWVDYGIFHAPYKQKHWPLPSDPAGFVNLNQQPYRTSQTPYRKAGEMVQFWSGLHVNAAYEKYFNPVPQQILGMAWSELDAPDYPDPQDATNESKIKPAVINGHSRFQIFTVALRRLPRAPFIGWTDRFGYVVPGNGTPGIDQVPLVVTEGVPEGVAMLNRPVKQNDPNAAPIMEF